MILINYNIGKGVIKLRNHNYHSDEPTLELKDTDSIKKLLNSLEKGHIIQLKSTQ